MAIIGISGKIGSGKDTVGKIIQILSHLEKYKKAGGNVDDIFNPRNWTWERALGIDGTFGFSYPENGGWEIKKFADKLKDATCLIIGCTRSQLEDQEFKNKPLGDQWKIANSNENLTPRTILQLLGTECGRDIIHPNIWVNSTFANYKPYVVGEGNLVDTRWPNWIVTDVRFPNEAEEIKDREGLLLRIERPCKECGVLEGHKMIPHKNPPSDHPSEVSLDDYPNFHYRILNNGTIEELVEQVKEILNKSNLL